MNFWQMQLHPGNSELDLKEVDNIVQNYSVIGMGEKWDNDGGVPYQFKHNVNMGDIVIIRHQGNPRYLVEVIGECTENKGDNKLDVWFGIYRKVKILSKKGRSYKKKYADNTGRSWSDGLFAPTTFQTANNWDFAKYWYEEIIKKINMEQYKILLETNFNLILTGAPGTGKTYLAKQIARQIILGDNEDKSTPEVENIFNEQHGFIQFHPSYDYTDFVEGLRPVQDDNGVVGFERKDGFFKFFCKKAIRATISNETDNFDESFQKIVSYLAENETIEIPLLSGKGKFTIKLNNKGDGFVTLVRNDMTGYQERDPSRFYNKEQCYKVYKGLSGVPQGGLDNYRKAIIKKMKDDFGLKDYKTGIYNANPPKYVFIIDEINRGEISKIFGELFFSIDPGYRGSKGKVKTQYQNLIEEGDEFYDGFYVPDNVYIIGTMNDIDRSVESMDFAMRRRFAFKEIKASDTIDMIKSNDTLKELYPYIEERMRNLNMCILKIQEFSSAYQIGAAYFLKLANYLEDGKLTDEAWENLWNNHLQGLLFEYLRGLPKADEKMQKLYQAFTLKDKY